MKGFSLRYGRKKGGGYGTCWDESGFRDISVRKGLKIGLLY